MVIQARPKYEIRSLAPADGYLAVYSHRTGDRIELETMPFDFVGVADLRLNRKGEWVNSGSEIVGVKLSDGDFDVLSNDDNFHGIVQKGATWDECVGLLPSELQSRVVKSCQPTNRS